MMYSPSSDEKPSQPRQRPGSACEECRRRKLRCDRQQPQCGVCMESGVICTINTARPPRGPKRGHLKALQSRIAALERCLVEQQGGALPPDQLSQYLELDAASLTAASNEELPQLPYGMPSYNAECPPEQGTGLRTPESIDFSTSSGPFVPDLVRADLDQLYFDRVHIFAPILNQRRYFTWTKQSNKSESRTCLQYAMWTLASTLSAQFQHIRDSLYRYARELLEAHELKDTKMEHIDIEMAQAWILLAIYEFMRSNYRRGWMSAGRSFRLVQLMRLYELDAPNSITQGDWIETEEKRRTFWMAYSLDRFISIRNGWPLTLSEEVISTRLPCPEKEFQAGQPILMGFLSEALSSPNPPQLSSSFTECIILATIYGRALSHRQQSNTERSHPHTSHSFWERHHALDSILTQRIQILGMNYPSAIDHNDPMLLFTHMVAQTTVLYLCKVMDSMPLAADTQECQPVRNDFVWRSLLAAQEILDLSKGLGQLSYFKVHPFTPIPLFICAEFFMTHRVLDASFDLQLQEVLEVLGDLKSVNNLAQDQMKPEEVAIDPAMTSVDFKFEAFLDSDLKI